MYDEFSPQIRRWRQCPSQKNPPEAPKNVWDWDSGDESEVGYGVCPVVLTHSAKNALNIPQT